MTEWQPINTAPKDGTEIDVWVRKFDIGSAGLVTWSNEGRRTDVRWGLVVHVYVNPYEHREGTESEWCERGHLMDWEAIEIGGYRITHWMPKPDAPAGE